MVVRNARIQPWSLLGDVLNTTAVNAVPCATSPRITSFQPALAPITMQQTSLLKRKRPSLLLLRERLQINTSQQLRMLLLKSSKPLQKPLTLTYPKLSHLPEWYNAQSYSIHSVIDGKCIPLVFALLCNKDESTYTFLLQQVNQHIQIAAGSVMLDFEKATMNAFSTVMPQMQIRNCFFHLCQSVQKRIFKKFKVQYKVDKVFARASRLVVFLAFVPLESIEAAFEALSVYVISIYPALLDVLNYFEKTYLGLPKIDDDSVREKAKYDVKFWNHFDTILNDKDFPRTSNLLEGFHRGFRTRVTRAKPTVQEYSRGIIEQQVLTDFHLDRLMHGITPAKKRRTNNEELQNICKSFWTYTDILEYIFEVARYFGHYDPM